MLRAKQERAMKTTEKDVIDPPENGSENVNPSADNAWDGEKYPSWQKSIGKEYWGNEKLNEFGSMKDVIESIVNPKKKAPEKYEGFSDELSDVAEALKSADIGQEDAKKISDAISKHLPKKYTEEALKDVYGADWEQAEKDYRKAVDTFIANEKDRKMFDEMKNNPLLFSFVRVVGRKIGDSPNLDLGKQIPHEERSKNPVKDILLKHMK